jgi:type IV pilus assembly protein PilW
MSYGARSRGFSLVELMVGITIALITILGLTGVLGAVNAQKRTTVGSSDAQTIGSVASFMIERDLRRAGYGINSEPMLGCSLHFTDPSARASPIALNPIMISAGLNGGNVLTMAYETGRHGWYYAALKSAYAGDEGDLSVDNIFGFSVGDLVAIGNSGVDPNADGIPDCTVRQITAIDSANLKLSNTPADYNKSGGEGIAYPKGSTVYNIGIASAGELPDVVTYSVNSNNELVMSGRETGFVEQTIAEQIVMLQAWYCKDTSATLDGTIDACDQIAPTNAADWRRVIAVRFALVARSPSREIAEVSDATLTLWPDMDLPSGTTVTGPTMTLTTEQRHYRYRVYGTMVPIRNMIWQVPS